MQRVGRSLPGDDGEPTAWEWCVGRVEATSPFCGLVRGTADTIRVLIPPPAWRDRSLVDKPASVARIGGDEFAVLLPATDIAGGEAVLATLAGLIELNNKYYPDFELSVSTGIATSRPGDRLEQVVKRADMKMLHAKRLYYLQANRDRRGTGAA